MKEEPRDELHKNKPTTVTFPMDNLSSHFPDLKRHLVQSGLDIKPLSLAGMSYPLSVDIENITRLVNSRKGSDSILQDSVLFNPSFDRALDLSDEINKLKRKVKTLSTELEVKDANYEAKIKVLEDTVGQLEVKEKTNHILARISEGARKRLFENPEFINLFENSSECEAVVVSIDIRRSTELMLKARKPELFAKFITDLKLKLSNIIIRNFGIFDKFTGDGILAFFPKFYSGKEAIIRALKSAQECHLAFAEHYSLSKNCFNVFIKDVGLGVGVDFGTVSLVNSQSELSVVGIPVVYACRFSAAKAGDTILNQPAKEEVMALCPSLTTVMETEIVIKNEGTALAYKVSLNDSAFVLPDPNWDELTKEYTVKENGAQGSTAIEHLDVENTENEKDDQQSKSEK